MRKLFVASSKESLPVAESIQENLSGYAEVILWNQGIFDVSTYALEALEAAGQDFDYGVFVMTPDDLRKKGDGTRSVVPRDNVIFEFGLFVGSLGRQRSFLVVPEAISHLQLPSDVSGLTQARYNPKESLPAALGSACTKIKRAIERVESRTTLAHEGRPTEIAPECGGKVHSRQIGSLVHQAGRLPPSYSGRLLSGAREEITILGFSLRSFIGYFDSRPDSEIRAPVRDALNRGVRLTLLCLDPKSKAAKAFAIGRGGARLIGEICRSLERAIELKSEFRQEIKRAKIDIKIYSSMPFAHVKRIDGLTNAGRLMCFQYLPGLRRADSPYFEVSKRANPLLFEAFSKPLDIVIKESRSLL